MNDKNITEKYREIARWLEEREKAQIAINSAYPLGEILEVTDKNISEINQEIFEKCIEKPKEELAKMPKFSEQMESKEKDKSIDKKIIDAGVNAIPAVCGYAYVKMQLITKLLELLFPTTQYVVPETSETIKMKTEIVAVIRKYF